MTHATHNLQAVGPYTIAAEPVKWLASCGRMQPVTIGPLRDEGFLTFGWLVPGEQAPGGHTLTECDISFGAYVYQTASGRCIAYARAPQELWEERMEKYAEEMRDADESEEDKKLKSAFVGLHDKFLSTIAEKARDAEELERKAQERAEAARKAALKEAAERAEREAAEVEARRKAEAERAEAERAKAEAERAEAEAAAALETMEKRMAVRDALARAPPIATRLPLLRLLQPLR
eukprot:1975996-Prymnesium_polylepis.2